MKAVVILVAFNIINLVLSASVCNHGFGPNAYSIADGLCAWVFSSNLTYAREMAVAVNNDVLVVATDTVKVMWDANHDGIIESKEMSLLINQTGLTHSIKIHNGFVYASTDTTVYRWAYHAGLRSDLGAGTVVLKSMPEGGHISRTLVFDSKGALYISIGSGSNIDSNADRAHVVRCQLDLSKIPVGGYDYKSSCEVWGGGTRNEAGLAFDPLGRLWGVENGMDDVHRTDLGGDIHQTNPCEEINIFQKPGFYGYPYCFSEYNISAAVGGQGRRAQWAHENTINDGTHSDAWCKNTSNVVLPAWCMNAHTAPLGLLFHESPTFPEPFKRGLFVTQHGSWDRVVPAGYKIVHIGLDSNYNPVSETKIIGAYGVVNGGSEKWNVRPVSLAKLAPCGPAKECLLFTSDSTNNIIAIAAV